MKSIKKRISGWGNFPKVNALQLQPTCITDLQEAIKLYPQLLARGAGKSYGDSSLFHTVLDMTGLKRILDEGEDWIEVEAGITLEQILLHIVPKGKFLSVTPGTKTITIGGAIASNVHGKNHYQCGSFVNHVLSIKVLNEHGNQIECSHGENQDLFYNSFGTMGLIGIIVSAKLKLINIETCYLQEKKYFAGTIDDLFAYFEQNKNRPFMVGWLDLLNNEFSGVVKTANWLSKNETSSKQQQLSVKKSSKINIPITFPFAPLPFVFKMHNKKILLGEKKTQSTVLHYDDYFYLLDNISNWNRAFGPKGFVEYQAAFSPSLSIDAIKAFVQAIHHSKATCTLAVLKIFGKENQLAKHSFPMEGYNIAMDFLNNKHVTPLIKQLDIITAKYSGRIYKTKDSLSSLPSPISATKFQSNQNIRYGNS